MSRLEDLLQVRLSESLESPEALSGEDRIDRLVKIFAGMKPAEAARVLEGLTDAEAELLLTRMSPRQGSKVLGSLNPLRAARLSKRVLGLAPEPELEEGPAKENRWYEEEAW
jgi:flagellar motility protein MotE (MotC chaperone)